jgi:hypothetical protein
MSKKDYQAIAAALYTARKDSGINEYSSTREIWIHECVVQNIASVLEDGNPRFDRERFIEACETGKCRGMRQVA